MNYSNSIQESKFQDLQRGSHGAQSNDMPYFRSYDLLKFNFSREKTTENTKIISITMFTMAKD